MTTEQLYRLYLQHPVISTDTRRITAGSIFFALKGDKFDANTFAGQAIAAGAAYAVIDNPAYCLNEQCIVVDDALTALQNLARHHRRQLNIPVIGLTGSNGKTTTKELINAVLSQKFNTLATQGNLNNHIGVPLTVLSINSRHQVAVIEMGANHQREIALLCSIAQPSHGLITNIGKAHLEGFGGVEGVKIGKGELYDYLGGKEGKKGDREADRQGVAFVNGDDKVLMAMQQSRGMGKVILYGMANQENTVMGSLTGNSPYLSLKWLSRTTGETHTLNTQLTGAYNLDNILAAICIGVYFELESEAINKGVEGYVPQNNRSQVKQTATNTLICDYYNANPSSMVVAIGNLATLQASRKVLILGDMFELGSESAAEHAAVIKKAMDADVNERIFIGPVFGAVSGEQRKPESADNREYSSTKYVKTSGATFYATVEDTIAGLTAHPIRNATILIKGSRGMALERLADLF